MEFKDELKTKRLAMGLTQKEMAERLGISYATVNRLEGGRFKPRADTLERFYSLDSSFALPLEGANVFDDLASIVEESRSAAIRAVNVTLLRRNHLLGKRISEEILKEGRADYGAEIISKLSMFLTEKYGGGFDRSSLYFYVQFYRAYPNIFDSANRQSFLSWTHYRVLLGVDSSLARSYYEKEANISGWSVRQLQRAIHSQSYERLLSTKGKAAAEASLRKALPAKANDPEEYIKNPVVMEFLGLPEKGAKDESELEDAIISHLAEFLLELGKGYTFVARQKRLPGLESGDKVDLVFYNIFLRCYVLIDLKADKLEPRDVGQMDSYVRYYDDRFALEGDGPTIGILLCAETSEDVIRYSALYDSTQLYAAKYKTYLPDREELLREIDRQKAIYLLAANGGKRDSN